MIDRNSPIYQEAKWRVKIGHAFLEKGYDIKGVMHVGANDGYEVEYYLQLGIEKVLCFEPHPIAIKLFKEKYAKEMDEGRVKLFPFALGSENKTATLRCGANSGQSSTFLRVNPEFANTSPFCDTEIKDLGRVNCEIMTFTNFLEDSGIDISDYDCLVIDVEGMEMDVLKGMGSNITNFKYLNIECSRKAIFQGQSGAQNVIDYLAKYGFMQDSPIEEHNDIMFLRVEI